MTTLYRFLAVSWKEEKLRGSMWRYFKMNFFHEWNPPRPFINEYVRTSKRTVTMVKENPKRHHEIRNWTKSILISPTLGAERLWRRAGAGEGTPAAAGPPAGLERLPSLQVEEAGEGGGGMLAASSSRPRCCFSRGSSGILGFLGGWIILNLNVLIDWLKWIRWLIIVQGWGSPFIFCGSGSSCFSQFGVQTRIQLLLTDLQVSVMFQAELRSCPTLGTPPATVCPMLPAWIKKQAYLIFLSKNQCFGSG